MPAKSKAQYRYFRGVQSGSIPPPKGMTRAQAAEYVEHQSPKGLPEKTKPKQPAKRNSIKPQRQRQMRKGGVHGAYS